MNRSALAERFVQASFPLKTFLLEAHTNGDVSGFLDGLGGSGTRLQPTADANLHRLADGETEFFIDHLDERFWSFHTWSPAVEAHRKLKLDVERRRDLDWTWLPSGHLRRVWSECQPTWLRSDFSGDRVLPEDDPARRMQLRLGGNSPEGLLRLVEGSPYANAMAYDQVGVAADDPAFGHVDEAVNRMGRFVATGQSFQLHEEIVRLAVQRYRRLITAVEDRALSWSGDENSGVTLKGSPIARSFGRS